MWPVVLGKVVAGAALAVVGLVVWQKLVKDQQEQERHEVYWDPFHRSTQSNDTASTENIKEQLLENVRIKLLDVMKMQPGRERSAAIRDLRARYHPDRHVHLPMLAAVFEELTALINTRTDPLLDEDRRHYMILLPTGLENRVILEAHVLCQTRFSDVYKTDTSGPDVL